MLPTVWRWENLGEALECYKCEISDRFPTFSRWESLGETSECIDARHPIDFPSIPLHTTCACIWHIKCPLKANQGIPNHWPCAVWEKYCAGENHTQEEPEQPGAQNPDTVPKLNEPTEPTTIGTLPQQFRVSNHYVKARRRRTYQVSLHSSKTRTELIDKSNAVSP